MFQVIEIATGNVKYSSEEKYFCNNWIMGDTDRYMVSDKECY